MENLHNITIEKTILKCLNEKKREKNSIAAHQKHEGNVFFVVTFILSAIEQFGWYRDAFSFGETANFLYTFTHEQSRFSFFIFFFSLIQYTNNFRCIAAAGSQHIAKIVLKCHHHRHSVSNSFSSNWFW